MFKYICIYRLLGRELANVLVCLLALIRFLRLLVLLRDWQGQGRCLVHKVHIKFAAFRLIDFFLPPSGSAVPKDGDWLGSDFGATAVSGTGGLISRPASTSSRGTLAASIVCAVGVLIIASSDMLRLRKQIVFCTESPL